MIGIGVDCASSHHLVAFGVRASWALPHCTRTRHLGTVNRGFWSAVAVAILPAMVYAAPSVAMDVRAAVVVVAVLAVSASPDALVRLTHIVVVEHVRSSDISAAVAPPGNRYHSK